MSDLNKIYNSHASLGRFGDTEMRMVDGVPSHVNSEEAHLIDMYGSQGEKLVKSIGSGAINPNTGLPEYEPISAATWAAVTAMTALGSWFVGSLGEGAHGATEARKANIQKTAAEDRITKFTEAQTDLDLLESEGRTMMTDRYKEDIGNVKFGFRRKRKRSMEQGQKLRQKSNLFYGGTAEKSIETEREEMTEALGRKESSMWGTLQEKISKFNVDIGAQRRGIDASIAQENVNIDLAESQAEQWYPWKNTKELFS